MLHILILIKMKKLFILLLLYSCSKQNNQELISSDREMLISLETLEDQKSMFSTLSDKAQTDIWLNKLNQLLTNKSMPSEVLIEIKNIHQILSREGISSIMRNPDFHKSAAKLFEVIPEADLMAMFSRVEDYTYIGKYDNQHPIQLEKNAKDILSTKGSPCTCSWCLFVPFTTGNCVETESGCGWLWQSPCTQTYQ